MTPVALFVYGRPEHTLQTIKALAANDGALDTRLFVFADGPREEADRAKVEATRTVVRSAEGFRSVELVERQQNIGLTENITTGVTQLMEEFGQAIVLEDDIVTSPAFLAFMNAALDKYRDDRSVWHIAGWNYDIPPHDLPEMYFYRLMNCWGWASWADRWAHYRYDPVEFDSTMDHDAIRRFNLESDEHWYDQIYDNIVGRLHNWDALWYATIFRNQGLCLNPVETLVDNIGLDGSGVHCGIEGPRTQGVRMTAPTEWPSSVEENARVLAAIRESLRKPLLSKVRAELKRAVKYRGYRP